MNFSRRRARSIAMGGSAGARIAVALGAWAMIACGGPDQAPPRNPPPVEPPPAGAPLPDSPPSGAKGRHAAGFVTLEDATGGSGIDFRHVNGASGNKYMVETLGSGLCVFDFDGDDRQDVYFVQSGRLPGYESSEQLGSELFRNRGGGRFDKVEDAAGAAGPQRYGFGCVAGDIDGDGDRDLYVTYYGPNVLYRNDGKGHFVDVTDEAGVGDPLWGAGAAFADYDGDGDLDLYVANYVAWNLEENPYCGENRPGYRTVCHPKNFDSQPDVLYRNRGDGTFEDVSSQAGIVDRTGKGLGVIWVDYDDDGDEDLYVANDDTPNFLFRNEGNGTFREIGALAGVAMSEDGIPQAGMGTDMGDYDNDGLIDLFVTNLAEETNELYRNVGGGIFEHATFSAGLGGPSLLYLGFGTFFFDPDLDGDLDLFVANGHIIDNIELFSDTITFHQPPSLYRNLGNGRMEPAADQAGEALRRLYVGRGAVPFDIDDDGDEDVIMAQNDGPAVVLRNAGAPSRAWIVITLRGTPPNRDAIGARVTLESTGGRQVRQARTGRSYLSQGDRRIHFGLPEGVAIDRIVVRWPGRDGYEEAFSDVGLRQFVILEQGKGRRL